MKLADAVGDNVHVVVAVVVVAVVAAVAKSITSSCHATLGMSTVVLTVSLNSNLARLPTAPTQARTHALNPKPISCSYTERRTRCGYSAQCPRPQFPNSTPQFLNPKP